MATSITRLVITTNDPAKTVDNKLNISTSPIQALTNVRNWVDQFVAGTISSSVAVITGCVQASQTVTATGTTTAADTLTIGNVVLTAVASGATNNQWNVGANAAGAAANIAAAINASTSLAGIVTASAAAAVVTITAVVPGRTGNVITLAKSSTNLTLGGTSLAGGAEGTSSTIKHGL